MLGILAALAACTTAAPSLRSLSPDQKAQALLALQASDLRVATIAFRLAAKGSNICPIKTRLVGITLHDALQYAPALRTTAREVFGLGTRVAVLAVAPGSPADVAGVKAGDGLMAVQMERLAVSQSSRSSYANVGAAYALLERSAAAGSVNMLVERAGATRSLTVGPVAGCASRVQLLPSPRIEARADGTNLSVTAGLLRYVRDDDELALALAHEMAHNALGHRVLLDSQRVRPRRAARGADAAKVLDTERAADRLAYYLMARAGYDIGVVPGFWKRLYQGPARDELGPSTHPDSAARIADAELVSAEILRKRRLGELLSP